VQCGFRVREGRRIMVTPSIADELRNEPCMNDGELQYEGGKEMAHQRCHLGQVP
jgi:hypothetical protein